MDTFAPTGCVGYEVTLTDTAIGGSASAAQQFNALPADAPNQFTLGPIVAGTHTVPITGNTHLEQCNTGPTDHPVSSTTTDDGLFEMLGGVGVLVPDPNDQEHYSGMMVTTHNEQPEAGGAHVIDAHVEWDLRRRR